MATWSTPSRVASNWTKSRMAANWSRPAISWREAECGMDGQSIAVGARFGGHDELLLVHCTAEITNLQPPFQRDQGLFFLQCRVLKPVEARPVELPY